MCRCACVFVGTCVRFEIVALTEVLRGMSSIRVAATEVHKDVIVFLALRRESTFVDHMAGHLHAVLLGERFLAAEATTFVIYRTRKVGVKYRRAR